jgi:hypothetical protein
MEEHQKTRDHPRGKSMKAGRRDKGEISAEKKETKDGNMPPAEGNVPRKEAGNHEEQEQEN